MYNDYLVECRHCFLCFRLLMACIQVTKTQLLTLGNKLLSWLKWEDNKWTCTWISAQVSSATHIKIKNKSRKFWIPFILHDAKEIILSYLVLCNVDRFTCVYVLNITYATWPEEQNSTVRIWLNWKLNHLAPIFMDA